MRAVTHPSPGETVIVDRADPVPSPTDILVRVFAAGLNRADLLQRAGKYPAPAGWPADIPGLEYAGEVVTTGASVTRWRVGDRVMGLVGGGAHAELVVVGQDEALTVPAGMPFTEAAAIPEAFLTAWDALVLRGRAAPGELVLVHAIGSGVGTAATQLCRVLKLRLIGTSRNAAKLERSRALGLAEGVLTSDEQWPERVDGPVDVLIDVLGASAFEQNLKLMAPRGRLVVLGTMTGGRAPGIDLSLVLRHRLEIIGTAMRVRGAAERIALVKKFALDVLPMFGDGRLQPVLDRVVPITDIELAYQAMERNETFGKVVLQM